MFTQIKETYRTLRKLFKTDGNPSVVERGVIKPCPYCGHDRFSTVCEDDYKHK